MFNKVIGLLFLFTLASCSIAPLSGPQSAKTLGEGNWEVNSGFTYLPYVAVNRGITENLDLGATVEMQAFGLAAVNAKYSVYNNGEEGVAAAVAAGGFHALDTVNTKGFYVGPVLSYKSSWFEPYLAVRYNWLRWKAYESDSDDRDDFIFEFLKYTSDMDVAYMQYTIGFNFWTSESFAFGVDAKILSMFGSHVEKDDRTLILPGLNFIWKL